MPDLYENALLGLCRRLRPYNPFPQIPHEPFPACIPPIPMEKRVTLWLRHYGVDATYEYPGFLSIDVGLGQRWAIGTVNPEWYADLQYEFGAVVKGSYELPFPSTHVSSGRDIAVSICAHLIYYSLNRAHRMYSGMAGPNDTPFGRLHDFCDANMLLPGCNTFEEMPDDYTDFCNDVMDAVNAVVRRRPKFLR